MSPADRTVFVDTSALYATLDADDAQHAAAALLWNAVLDGMAAGELNAITHSSVIVETTALVQRRLGMDATRSFLDDIVPLLEIVWVDADLHRQAATALLAAGHRQVSLVDWTSFELMRARAIDRAFAFDADFTHRGFLQFDPN